MLVPNYSLCLISESDTFALSPWLPLVYFPPFLYSWDHLVHKNFELEKLCMDISGEVELLKKQAELRCAIINFPCIVISCIARVHSFSCI